MSGLAAIAVAVVAWALNEWAKRRREGYVRREESYRELLETLRGFYVATEGEQDAQVEARDRFLRQVERCWLYAPDDVINAAYAFLETVHVDARCSDAEKQLAAGDLVAAMRSDLSSWRLLGGRGKTELTGKDFRHLHATGIGPRRD